MYLYTQLSNDVYIIYSDIVKKDFMCKQHYRYERAEEGWVLLYHSAKSNCYDKIGWTSEKYTPDAVIACIQEGIYTYRTAMSKQKPAKIPACERYTCVTTVAEVKKEAAKDSAWVRTHCHHSITQQQPISVGTSVQTYLMQHPSMTGKQLYAMCNKLGYRIESGRVVK